MIAGILGGGIWAGIAGLLKAKLGVSEVINTIMLNYVATYLVAYLVDGPIQEAAGTIRSLTCWEKTRGFQSSCRGRGCICVILAAVSVVLVYMLLWKLPLGYQMRAVETIPSRQRQNGINVARNMVLAMFLSGAFAGLAGSVEIMGIHHRLMNGFSSSYGFDSMAVALLGGLHPVGVTIAAIFFGALRTGANTMQRTLQVPVSLVNVIQGLVILFVLMQALLSRFTIRIIQRNAKEKGQNSMLDIVSGFLEAMVRMACPIMLASLGALFTAQRHHQFRHGRHYDHGGLLACMAPTCPEIPGWAHCLECWAGWPQRWFLAL